MEVGEISIQKAYHSTQSYGEKYHLIIGLSQI